MNNNTNPSGLFKRVAMCLTVVLLIYSVIIGVVHLNGVESYLLADTKDAAVLKNAVGGLSQALIVFGVGILLYLARESAKAGEAFRKMIVSLKRNPTVIPLLMLVFTFLYYSLNLTVMSNSTAKIQGQGMGLCEFATSLFSILVLVCMLNAFPRRQKPNVLMLVLLFGMLAIMIFCDWHYLGRITAAVTRAESPIDVTKEPSIPAAANMLRVHIGLLIGSGVLVGTLPLYSKLLKKINTSVMVEENANMGVIELSE